MYSNKISFIIFLVFLNICFITNEDISLRRNVNEPRRVLSVVRRIINTTKAAVPLGPYSQAVQVGNTLYVSGVIGNTPTGGLVPGGIGAQTNQALVNLGNILAEAGTGYGNVVKTEILLANISDFATVNEIYKYFFLSKFPARATYQVGAIANAALIEIASIAVIGDIIDV